MPARYNYSGINLNIIRAIEFKFYRILQNYFFLYYVNGGLTVLLLKSVFFFVYFFAFLHFHAIDPMTTNIQKSVRAIVRMRCNHSCESTLSANNLIFIV